MHWQIRIVAVLVGMICLVACAIADSSTTLKSPASSAISSASENIPTVVIGYCHPVANGNFDPKGADSTLTPNVQAKEFLNYQKHHAIDGTTNTSILSMPKHGALYKVTEADKGRYYSEEASLPPSISYYIYIPEAGYVGKDNATVLVDFGSVRVKMVYFFNVTGNSGFSDCDWPRLCEKTQWEISSTLSSNNMFKTVQRTSAVVIRDYEVAASENNKAATFKPGSFLTLDRSSEDGKMHIEYYSGGDYWIPKDYVATKDQFSRVDNWDGVNSATYEGVDDVATYSIHKDGSVDSTYGDMCGSKALKGHLYRFKNILWVRYDNSDDIFSSVSFWLLPNGELCNLAWPCPTGSQ